MPACHPPGVRGQGLYAPPMVQQQPPTSLVPELDVGDLNASLRFYVDVIGFTVVFERTPERLSLIHI